MTTNDTKIPLTEEQLRRFYKQAYKDGVEAKNICGGLYDIHDLPNRTVVYTALIKSAIETNK